MHQPDHTAAAPGVDPHAPHRPRPGLPAAAQAAPSRGRIRSDALLHGARELEIVHGDAVYRLRVTAMGKLILTK
jgi:hemin uptake protein HemP